jgi:hypothetical protein
MQSLFVFFIPHPSSLLPMPSTPSGKAKSRMNALKHGLRATDELFFAHLPQQERRILKRLRASFHDEYNPRTPHEKLLVDQIAIQHLRLFRLYHWECEALCRRNRQTVLPHLDRFSRYDAAVERRLRALHNRLCNLYFQRHDYSLNFIGVKE